MDFITIQGNNITTTYIEYAVVSESKRSTGDINVGKMGEGQDLILIADIDEYKSFIMGESNQEINSFLKERKLRKDNVYIFPYVEMDENNYIIHIPVK